jgi:diguanylate cyclase (GGDEF)-like protein
MGYVSGWMYMVTGLVGLAGLAAPSLRFHPGWQLGLGLASVAYGLLTVKDIQRWGKRPIGVHIAAMAGALPLMVLGLWATGGSRSYLRPVLLLAPIHWAFFLRSRRVLAALCAGFILTYWVPQLYQPLSHTQSAVANTATLSLTVIGIAAALSLVRGRLDAAEEQLLALARRDPLTGLFNRRGFRAALYRMIETAPDDTFTYLVLLDLDHLKKVNDVYGHPTGDAALRRLAERLSGGSAVGDVIARLGGDEFALAGHTRDPGMVDRIAGHLQIEVSGELESVPGVQIEATTGWAVDSKSGTDIELTARTLFQRADQRLIVNKRSRHDADDSLAAERLAS